jgi:non-specific serine/threonine protein kinase
MTATDAPIAYRFGRFELQPDERRLLAFGAPVHVGPHAFDLLVALVERSGHLVTKDKLLERVWPKVVVEENTLQVHVSALRKILGAKAIATVSGRGYRFTLDVTPIGPPAGPAVKARHNLPHQLTSFVGREKEIAEIRQMLATTRLLTLTGAGGCGKTRLAMRVGADVAPAYRDGSWLVELAALADAALVPQAVANALAIKEQAGRSLSDTIAEHLASRQLLLVLDNAEHVLDACAQLADTLLRRCAQLVILVTSRERLGMAGEHTYRVPSLSVPDPGQDVTPEQIAAHESARLFIERARMLQPRLDVTTGNAAALGSICRRLDGIALAIELAAPRLRAMSLEELSRNLDERFGLLTGGSRTALPRHRTLRSLIDWSYDLLGDAEKSMLRRVSVFSGGWTLEAAQQVCGGDDIDASTVLDLLTSLTDKNLAIADVQEGATRHGLLETVRHYARDRLRESGEESRVQRRHLAYFLAMAEEADRQRLGANQQAALDGLERERDNLRSALSCSVSVDGEAGNGLRLAAALAYFWWLRGHRREGRAWLAGALAAASKDQDTAARAKALHGAAVLAYSEDDYQAARRLQKEALAIQKELGDRHGIGASLNNLGNIAASQGDYPAAAALFEEALAIHREEGDRNNTATTLSNLGWAANRQGDYAAAREVLEESLAIGRELGGWIAAYALNDLGTAAHGQGDYPAAEASFKESLAISREEGTRWGMAISLAGLGTVARSRGEHESAQALLKEALIILREMGQRAHIAESLEAFAEVALALAGPRAAARIWGYAERLREEIGAPMAPFLRASHERHVAYARAALGDDLAFDHAWQEGRAMSFDQAVQ